MHVTFQLGRAVPPRPIIAGEPLLTMRSVSSLEDLAPWFSTLSLSLTRQQTRSMTTGATPHNMATTRYDVHINSEHSQNLDLIRSPIDTIERIIEIDFMEEISS